MTKTDYVNDLNNLKTEVKCVRDPVQKVVGTLSFRGLNESSVMRCFGGAWTDQVALVIRNIQAGG